MMDIPFSRWYEAINKRRSRRNYNNRRQIEPEKLAALDVCCKQFNPFPHARTVLVNGYTEEVFTGIVGSYGKIRGAPAFIAFIGKMSGASVQEETGYTGEGIILEATALGLSTCWVGGTFRRERVSSRIELGPDERVLGVTPVGYAENIQTLQDKMMTGFGRNHKRMPLSGLVRKSLDVQPEWVGKSLDAARMAPSAMNRQPWGFDVEEKNITVFVRSNSPDFTVSKRLDCGIAMMHIEVAARQSGHNGSWIFLKNPMVARYSLSS
jgi:nitroreductase